MKKPLNILLLTVRPSNFSSKNLIKAGREAGHNIIVKRTTHIGLTDQGELRGPDSLNYDAVIPRIGGPIISYGTAVVQALEQDNIFTTASSYGLAVSKDKFLTGQVLKANGLAVPKTATFATMQNFEAALDYVGGYPIIVKLPTSSQGRAVIYVDNSQTGKSLIGTLINNREPFIIQEFVKEASGTDLRVFVIDGTVAGAMMRTAQEGEFRSNVHQGGSVKTVQLTEAERDCALKAAAVLKLKVAGIDILRSNSGPKILEVNSSPGLQGITAATGKNIAADIIASVEKNVQAQMAAA